MKNKTRRALLKDCYDMACHNLLCYSKDYSMNEPKEGFEEQWRVAKEECDIYKTMMDECGDKYTGLLKFTGQVSSYSVKYNKHTHEHFIEDIIVSDKDDNHRLFKISVVAGRELLKTYDKERHIRYDLGMSTDIVFTVRNFDQWIESWQWKVAREVSS